MRQQYYSEPWRKHLEIYHNLTGGLNTVKSNENLSDNEFRDLTNIDLGRRGSLPRRYGMKLYKNVGTGKGQGYFRYYKSDGTYDELVAINGSLVINGTTATITGLASFQTTRPVEAVQFGNKMYIATGTKLVQWDGTSASVVQPYTPEPLEILYIGTNALAADPYSHIKDGESTFLRIDAVTFSRRYGLINEPTTLKAFSSYPAGSTIEYRFEYRRVVDMEGFWEIGQDWSTAKEFKLTPRWEGDFQFRVKARIQGDLTTETPYLVPKYKVKPALDPKDVENSVTGIHGCNRIILHWNRLIMYGDVSQPDMIYISHLNNPSYFPTPNTLRFENPRQEALTKIVQYRDMLVSFTKTSIQALFGKSPADYRRVMLNTDMGCIAPNTAKVLKNNIVFLSHEGVHMLKAVGYTEDKANVEKIDINVENIVEKDENACSVIFDNQYHILFPDKNKRLRYYYEYGVWTKDESPKLDFERFYHIDGKLYGQSLANGSLMVFDKSVYDDDGYVYEDLIESKYYDFGQPHHSKKLKELQLMFSPSDHSVSASVYVYADASNVLGTDESYASVDANGNIVWNIKKDPNFSIDSGTVLGDWKLGSSPFGEVEHFVEKLRVSGKCLKAKVIIKHAEPHPSVLLGLAFIFKVKKA